MKAQHSFGLNLSWLRVTTVFLIDLAILRLAGHWPTEPGSPARAWWPGVGVAVVVTAAALITHRRVPLTSIVLARVLDRFANPVTFLNEGCTPGFDHRRRYSHDVVGLREHRGQLVAVIAVAPPPAVTSGRHPMRNAEAVAVRDSVAATLAAATERLAQTLQERHIVTRVLPAEEFGQVDATVLAGLQPTRIRRRRRRLKQKHRKGPRQYAATFWMSPRDITTANLEQLWQRAADTTAVTVRLIAQHNHTDVSVLVRYHTGSRLRRNMWAGLNRLNGRQLTALRTSLPTPMRRTLAVPARQLDDHEPLQVPLGPTAQQPLARVKLPA